MQRLRAKDTPVEETYFAQRFGTIEFLRRLRDDQLSVIVPELFDRNMIAFNHLFLHGFLINKPEYIEHVLLTNQANYTKSHFLRRMLGPLLGEGLLISEGESWRRQRRIWHPLSITSASPNTSIQWWSALRRRSHAGALLRSLSMLPPR
jgi:cytochrome P450